VKKHLQAFKFKERDQQLEFRCSVTAGNEMQSVVNKNLTASNRNINKEVSMLLSLN
jgi:hypothetical protein